MKDPWTDIEIDVIETLTRRVRLLSLSQVGDLWWPDAPSQRVVRRLLRRLRQAGLLCRTVINVQPRTKIKTPLCVWQVGCAPPSTDQIVQRLQRRWRNAAAPTEVYWASPLAANLFGSTAGKLPGLTHRDHDLLLGDVFLFYRRLRPSMAALWVGEDARPKAGHRIKDPDALLIGHDGRPLAAIESAGRYGQTQLTSFHAHCENLQLAYELY